METTLFAKHTQWPLQPLDVAQTIVEICPHAKRSCDRRSRHQSQRLDVAASVEEGVRVKAFASPQEALDWICGTMPDLVITDFKMPGMDGADFTRAFRAIPAQPTCPWWW